MLTYLQGYSTPTTNYDRLIGDSREAAKRAVLAKEVAIVNRKGHDQGYEASTVNGLYEPDRLIGDSCKATKHTVPLKEVDIANRKGHDQGCKASAVNGLYESQYL